MVAYDQRLGRKEQNMYLISVDYYPSIQQTSFLIEETGECGEQRLNHSEGDAERFYRDLQQSGICLGFFYEADRWTACLENTGVSIVPPTWNGNESRPFSKLAPANLANVFVKKPCRVVIFAMPS